MKKYIVFTVLLILAGVLAFWAMTDSSTDQKNDSDEQEARDSTPEPLDLAQFATSETILLGRVPAEFTPRRKYRMVANTSGELELNVPYENGFHPAGTSLGVIDRKKLVLDEAILNLKRRELKKKEIPDWEIKRQDNIEQANRRKSNLQAELQFAEKVLEKPAAFTGLFTGLNENEAAWLETIEKDRQRLKKQIRQVDEKLRFLQSEEYGEIELGLLKKRLKSRVKEFQDRRDLAYLTTPFDGEVQFLYPYVEDERNFVQNGDPIAEVRDLSEITAQVPMLDSEWRELSRNRVKIQVGSRIRNTTGQYREAFEVEDRGGPQLLYRFAFPESVQSRLKKYIGGSTQVRLVYDMRKEAHLIPKLKLAKRNPEAFREGSWEKVLEEEIPGAEIEFIGLHSIAVTKP